MTCGCCDQKEFRLSLREFAVLIEAAAFVLSASRYVGKGIEISAPRQIESMDFSKLSAPLNCSESASPMRKLRRLKFFSLSPGIIRNDVGVTSVVSE